MGTQKRYDDHCELCGRELVGNGTKSYLSAYCLHRLKEDYQGRDVLGREAGAVICRSVKKCGNQPARQKAKELFMV